MKAVIFAGGVGTRLWPLSRKASPKQFEKIIGNKSTLQLAIERLLSDFKPEDIYVSTGAQYVDMVAAQLNYIPKENIIGEPEKKDVGPAVAFMMGYLSKRFPNESVIILWSDHLVKYEKKFMDIVRTSCRRVEEEQEHIVFIGQKPRFASENLGWIETSGKEKSIDSIDFYSFAGFKYRPDKQLAEKYFKDSKYCWNLGYFVSTPHFMHSLFKRFTPHIHSLVEKILESEGTDRFQEEFAKYYHEMPEISFDNAVLEQLDNEYASVVMDDIGWSDVGAWEALKEALEENREDNITKGKVFLEDTTDCLVYNFDENKTVVGIDLDDMLVINTGDVLLVTKKTSVPKIKKVVEKFAGTENESLT